LFEAYVRGPRESTVEGKTLVCSLCAKFIYAGNQVLYTLLILSHPFWAAFDVLSLGLFSILQGIMSRPDLGNIVHISRVHQQLLLVF